MVSSDLNVAAVQVQLRDVDTTQVPRIQDAELRFLLGGFFLHGLHIRKYRGVVVLFFEHSSTWGKRIIQHHLQRRRAEIKG